MTVVVPFRTSLAAEPEALEAGIVMHLDGTVWWLKPDGTQVQLGGGGGSFNGGTITEPLAITLDPGDTNPALNITGGAGGSAAIMYAYDGNGNLGLTYSTGTGFLLTGRDDGSPIFQVGPTGAVTISPSDDSASPAQVEIIAGAGSEANGSEIFQITGDTGNRLFGFDGIGQFTVDMYELAANVRASSFIQIHPFSGGTFAIAKFSSGLEDEAPGPTGDGGAQLRALSVSMPARLSTAQHDVIRVEHDGKLGFFEATPVDQPTGVAVTAGGIHAALVTLGLITA